MKTCYNICNKIKEILNYIIFPSMPKCSICSKILLYDNHIFCDECINKLEWIKDENRCLVCGKELNYESSKICPSCENEENVFTKGYSLFRYDIYSKKAIRKIKYENHQELAINLGKLLFNKTKHLDFTNDIDVILPTPLHKNRFRIRGYNQAYLIAKGYNDLLNKPLSDDILTKETPTLDQIGLNKTQRAANLKGAFSVKHKEQIKDKKILLIDDVFTTGATINLLSEKLINSGAKEVYFLTICSTKIIY